MNAVDRVVAHAAVLGDPAGWAVAGVQENLAVAVIEAVWGIGVRAGGVANVIARYEALRGERPHTPAELAAFVETLGGPEAFADAVRNRQRTSTRNGILKAEAVYLEARMLGEEGVVDASGLSDAVRARWITVPGQKSGTSWDALLIATGHDTVKADRMLRRFVAVATGTTEARVSAARAHTLVVDAAARLGVSARALDYAIWRHESRAA
ncbi:hypothetical protein DVA67_010735 [Solirubrobacter sp. CPCC 204708]|uniref:Heme peroxidase n=1 Tax=Solirubrobacter deserti TaxID=2282478 RepID=A0ABT4RU81_9ACTN|nr:hypothetical protein [Solirubrobacter deserti]MBE2316453.1 hypothetical protein [Solirubrobacter deserti]MDA0142143.1 hypothetical protein [Solirubrobacter deserti]